MSICEAGWEHSPFNALQAYILKALPIGVKELESFLNLD